MLEDGPGFIGFHALRAAAASARSLASRRVDGVAAARPRDDAVEAARIGPNSKIRPPPARSPPDAVAAQRAKTIRRRARASGIMSSISCMTAARSSRSKCDSTLRGARTVARPPARDARTL